MKNHLPVNFVLVLAAACALAACSRPAPAASQGYIEGDFVYVASPLAGRVEKLAVKKGDRVAAGQPLFSLEQSAEVAAAREAADRLRQSQARLADLQKGERPTELAALEARVAQGRAGAELAARELERVTRLHDTKVLTDDDFDRARLNHESAVKLVAESEAELATAQLGGRADVIGAAEADAAAAQAALDRANWSVAQKNLSAPADALVYDTLFREGEFAPAGIPVVALLPPGNIKVRFFVPEAEFGALKAGATVKVAVSGQTAPLDARISYLSPAPEYTPPVLYNRDNRSKLVFLVEAVFDPVAARDLHPGQPVDVMK